MELFANFGKGSPFVLGLPQRRWNVSRVLGKSFFCLFLLINLEGGSLGQSLDEGPSYTLGSADVIQISVWKDENLTREVIIRPDGYVSFPLVGDVLAQGKTVEDFAKDLKTRLSRFVPNPPVSVAVLQLNSYKIYVIGKVNRPGEFQVGHPTDVMQALSLAGGVTPFASQSKIKVLRRIQGKQVIFPFDYGDVLSGENLEQNILLERWDIVMVP